MSDDDWAADLPVERSQSQLRIKCHSMFDPIWKSGAIPRKYAYKALAEELGCSEPEAHFGQMTVEGLEKAIPAINRLRDRLL